MRRITALLAVGALPLSACSGLKEGFETNRETGRKISEIYTDVTVHEDPCLEVVYAQGEVHPYEGARLTSTPERVEDASNRLGKFEPNDEITVMGWVDTGAAAYPDNGTLEDGSEPWDGNEWLVLADGSGYVNHAAVRNQPTSLVIEDGAVTEAYSHLSEQELVSMLLDTLVELDPACEQPLP